MGYQREKVARHLLDVEQTAAGTHATQNPRAARAPGSRQCQPSKGRHAREGTAQVTLEIERHRKHSYRAVLPTSASRADSRRPLDGRKREKTGLSMHGPARPY
jgi:hypothetical protein